MNAKLIQFSLRSPKRTWLRYTLQGLLALFIAIAVCLPVPKPVQAWVPTISIVAVATDSSVTIQANNFPAGQEFTVRMGNFGTLAIGGTVVGTTNSGAGGNFQETYSIPDWLKGQTQIAIRMDSPGGYYAYNWFYNNTSGSTSGGSGTSYSGIPTFSIVSVVEDDKVTIRANNFPASKDFKVLMGAYGTYGVGGIQVATTSSGSGGSFEETYSIPDSLKGSAKIAVRMESSGGYYAYNWFYNNSTGSSSDDDSDSDSSYSGVPTFSIVSVVRDDKVTVKTKNFRADTDYTVKMNYFGTLGVGGTVVATTNSGSGGSFEETYSIPDWLDGSYQIAIRMEGSDGYYAYNWFYNNTTDGSSSGGTSGGSTYVGVPTFTIKSVVQNSTVTILTNNLPSDQEFTVRMGPYGTLGQGGTVVNTFNSGSGGAQTLTYTIPDGLKGLSQIAIRMDSNMGYYAFNWFYNNTTN